MWIVLNIRCITDRYLGVRETRIDIISIAIYIVSKKEIHWVSAVCSMHADHCTIQFYGLRFSFEFRLKKYQKTIHHNTENKRPIIQFRCRPALTPDSTCPVFITLILYNKFHSSIKRMIQTVHSKVFFITDQIERSSEFSSKIRSAENFDGESNRS